MAVSGGEGLTIPGEITISTRGAGAISSTGVSRDVLVSFKLALIYASITMGVDYKSYNYYLKIGGDVKGLSVTLLFYIILSHMLSRGHLSTGCFGYRDYWSRWSSRSCGWLRAKNSERQPRRRAASC